MSIRSLFSFIVSYTYKCNIIIFNSFPDLSGNSIALYEYIVNQRPDILSRYRLVWTVEGNAEESKNQLRAINPSIKHRVVLKKSILGCWFFLHAKYLVTTHGYFGGINATRAQKHISLWHGMPFKKIGNDLEQKSSTGHGIYADYTIATSDKYQEIMSSAFGISKENVLVVGQPCNDLLFSKKDVLSLLGYNTGWSKILIWMPTYRKSFIGDIREDGRTDGFGVEDVLLHHVCEVNDELIKHNYLLLIKPHPMDVINNMELPTASNIHIIKNNDLASKSIQLYELLAQSDVLFTDYSSVFIDYLATGKPIAFICDDIEEYDNSRGFYFSPAREYMPGELISCIDDFVKYLKEMDAINEKWQAVYSNMQVLLNMFQDSQSSERLCNRIWGDWRK